MRSSLPLITTLAACAVPPPVTPPPSVVTVEASPSTVTAPPRALPVAPARCAVSTDDWRAVPQSWELLLEEGGPVFGRVLPDRDGVASVAFPGERAVADVHFEGRVLRLDTLAVPASVQLFTETSVTFAEVVHTVGSRPLTWAATPTRRHVDLELSFRPWGGAEQSLTSRVACEQLSLAPADFDQGSFVDLARSFGRQLVGDEPLSVRRRPNGPVALTLPAPARFVKVAVLDKQGGRRRVATTVAPDLWLVGWVDADRLAPLNGGHGGGCMGGRGRLGRSLRTHPTSCSQRLPLYVAIEGKRARVGELQANTPFHPRGERDDGFTAITPRDRDVRLREGAEWLVPDEPLRAHCARR